MIVCVGESLVDMIPRQLADGSDVFLPVPGGALFNTAVALGRLGLNAAMVSGISTDLFGEQLIAFLEESGVEAGFAVRSNQPATLAFVALKNGEAQYSFFDENSAGRSVTEADLPDLPETVSALHFGAISLIGEPCGSAYEALAHRHAGGPVISLDPNIRTGFVKDEGSYRERLERMAAVADIIKVSDDDLAWLAHGAAGETLIGGWLGSGTSLVITTHGADGVTAHMAGGSRSFPADKVEVVDTIGAGDTFNAGLLAGLQQGGLLTRSALQKTDFDSLARPFALAAHVAALTVSRAGANPPWARELKAGLLSSD